MGVFATSAMSGRVEHANKHGQNDSAHNRLLQKLDLKRLSLKMLLKKHPGTKYHEVDLSHREHYSYGLLEKLILITEGEEQEELEQCCEQLISYTLPGNPDCETIIRQRKAGMMCINDFEEVAEIGDTIDYTGSVCVWPAEETLAYWLLSHQEMFRGKSICELGAGSGMAGIMLGLTGVPKSVCLTDGNPTVVRAIQQNLKLNPSDICSPMSAEALLWGNELAPQFEHMRNQYDCVVMADCTINFEVHQILVDTISDILSKDGFCLYLAPRRGKSLSKFVKLAKLHFDVEVTVEWDDKVIDIHHELEEKHADYDHKKNLPVQVMIRHKSAESAAAPEAAAAPEPEVVAHVVDPAIDHIHAALDRLEATVPPYRK